MKKISIIVPVYNSEKYLNKCIEALVNQTYNNLEIILVDDGSPDNCPQMCDEWAKKDKRIKVIHKTNGGVSSARNSGLDNATGEYIMFCDSDDWYEPQMCEKMTNSMDDNTMVICNYSAIASDCIKSGIKIDSIERISDKDKCRKLINEFYFMLVWNKIFVLEKIGDLRFDTELYLSEDYLFNLAYFSKCSSVIMLPDRLYNYSQISHNSLSRKYNLDSFDMHILALKKCVEYVDNKEIFFLTHLLQYLTYDLKSLKNDSFLSKKEKKKELYRIFNNTELKKIKYKHSNTFKKKVFYILLKMKLYGLIWRLI